LNFTKSAEDELMIFVDRQKFSLVLQNLISRAIEVSLEKQEVDVFVSIIDVEPPKLASSTSSSVHRAERRKSSIRSVRSNRVAGEVANVPPAGESEMDRELREEAERERENERQRERESERDRPAAVAPVSPNRLLRIGIHDRGPVLSEVRHSGVWFFFF
jgi:signal transduction histidine kinase